MLCVALVAVPGASASSNTNPECAQPKGGKTFAPLIRRAWAERKWQDATPVSQRQAKRIETHRRCARSDKAKRFMVRSARRQRSQFKAYREQQLAAASITPYDCGSAGRFAIPCYIVACESGYSWSAYNSSGAAGAYQIMPEHGRPWPITSEADKLAHHQIAARLYNGGAGAGNWVCA